MRQMLSNLKLPEAISLRLYAYRSNLTLLLISLGRGRRRFNINVAFDLKWAVSIISYSDLDADSIERYINMHTVHDSE